MDDALYREEILDHYRSSPYRGSMEAPDFSAELDNPLCGDHIHLDLDVDDDGKIAAIRFDGHGCALSQAGASMLAEHMEGVSLAEARGFTSESMLGLLGVKLTPTRIKCWLLGWRALQAAIPAEIQGGAAAATTSTPD
jgi:nitrogen fixation NifU-like protein